jgi:hypothetical protein
MTTNYQDEDLTIGYEAPLEMAPEGRHPALCVDVFETWPEEETWQGKTSTKRKIMFVFQVFPEDGARDSEGDVYRFEHKINFTFSPAQGQFPATALWRLLENWRGKPFSLKSAKADPKAQIGKTAWVTLEHKTRYVNLVTIEPYVDENGKPLPALSPASYKRRTYPHPDTWKKNQSNGNGQGAETSAAPTPAPASTNPYDPIPF